jgi:hypothetical protein
MANIIGLVLLRLGRHVPVVAACLVLIWLALFSLPLGAASIYGWAGGSGSNWATGGNWSPATAPTTACTSSTCNVSITTTSDPTSAHPSTSDNVSGTLTIGTITIGGGFSANVASGGTLIISSGGSNAGTLGATGASSTGILTLAGGTLTNTGGILQQSGTGTVSISSGATVSGGTLKGAISDAGTLAGGVAFSAATIQGSGSASITGAATSSGTSSLSGLALGTGASLNVTANTTTWTGGSNAGTLESISGGTLAVAGTLDNSNGILLGPTGVQTGTLTINSATVNNGDLQGKIASKGSTFSGATIDSGATLTATAGGTTNWTGGSVATGGSGVGQLDTGGGILDLTGSITNNGAIRNEGVGTLNNSATIMGGLVDVANSGSMNNSGTLESATGNAMTVNATNGGIINNTGGTINNNAGPLVIIKGDLTVNGGTVTGATLVSGTSPSFAGATLNLTGTVSLNGLTDGYGSVVNISGDTTVATMSGTFTNAGGAAGQYSLSGGTLNLDASSFNGQTLSQTGGTLDINGAVDPMGSYTLNGGELDLTSTYTVGTADLASGTVVDDGGQIQATSLTSDVTLDQSEVSSTNLTTMTLDGDSVFDVTPQTVTNDYNPNLTDVSGTLTLDGELNLGSFNLLPGSSQTAFTPYIFPIFQAGNVIGSFTTVCFDNGTCDAAGALPADWGLEVVNLAGGGEQVDLMNTPEPGTGLMLGGVVLLLGIRRRWTA